MYRIVHKEQISPVVHLMVIEAPEVAAKASPGQFVILRVDDEGERVPLTIADFDREMALLPVSFRKLAIPQNS